MDYVHSDRITSFLTPWPFCDQTIVMVIVPIKTKKKNSYGHCFGKIFARCGFAKIVRRLGVDYNHHKHLK